MPKHTFTETTRLGNKVFFAGEATVTSEEAKAIKSGEAEEAKPDPQASGKGKSAKNEEK
jgi:hypothetical protein